MKAKLRFIDVFAGIGGTRLGFESADFQCVFSSEWDPHSRKTYAENFGELPHGDITKVDLTQIPDFDVLVAGFPCQPFSSVGQRAGFDHPTQGTLFFELVKILEQKKPVAFMFENVKGLLSHDGGKTWMVIQDTLDGLGYTITSEIINSADFGLPQMRERIYIVGFRKDQISAEFQFPEPSHSNNWTGIGQFIENGVSQGSISFHLQKSYIFKKDDGRPQIVTTDSINPVKTLVASYHKIQRLTGTFVADGPTGLRLFTEAECKAVMGFPSDFKIPVSRTQMYRQFGNSVTVPVISAIAEKIKTQIKNGNQS